MWIYRLLEDNVVLNDSAVRPNLPIHQATYNESTSVITYTAVPGCVAPTTEKPVMG